MPPRPTHDPSYLDEHHQRISEFGAEYFDDDDEREAFVSELMTRRGYTPVTSTSWEPPADTGKGGGNGAGQGGQQRQKPAYFKR